MHKYILRRILSMIPVLLGVSFIVFSMLHIIPGDPARTLAGGPEAREEDVIRIRDQLGLNDPFIVQYGRWITNLVVHQDLGNSFNTGRSVTDEIMDRFPTTVQLAGASVLVAVLIGVPVGIISATKQYSVFDNVAMFLALVGVAMPAFWQGMLLILLFSLHLGWLPSIGMDGIQYLILPAFTLGTGGAALIARMTRSSMLEVVRQDYITTARAKGQTERVVINKHALKNALIPIVTVVGLAFAGLLGGAIITEQVFTIPGLGRLLIGSINQRDFPVVQGGVLYIALTFSLVNLFVDILYAFLDPRIKSQYR